MARIISDPSIYAPQVANVATSDTPGYRKGVQRASDVLGLAKQVADSPLTRLAIRGGQAIGHAIEDADLASAAARRAGVEQEAASFLRDEDLGPQKAEPSALGLSLSSAREEDPSAFSGLSLRDVEPGPEPLSLAPEQSPLAVAAARRLAPERTPQQEAMLARSRLGSSVPGLGLRNEYDRPGGLDAAVGAPVGDTEASRALLGRMRGDVGDLAEGMSLLADQPMTAAAPSTEELEASLTPAERAEYQRGLRSVGMDPGVATVASTQSVVFDRPSGLAAAAARRGAPRRGIEEARRPPIVQPEPAPPEPAEPAPLDLRGNAPFQRARTLGVLPGPPTSGTVIESPDRANMLGNASEAQLQSVRNRLAAQLEASPDDPTLQRRVARIDRELQDRQDRVRLDNRPLTEDEIYEQARRAATPEEQAAVLSRLSRVRVPISSLDDLLGDGPQTRLLERVKGLFPSGRDTAAATNAETKAQLADAKVELQRLEGEKLKAHTERDRQTLQGDIEKVKAQIDDLKAGAEGKREAALDKRERRPGIIAKTEAETKNLLSQVAARDAKLGPEIDKLKADSDRLRAIAEKARRIRTGRGGGTGKLSASDIRLIAEFNDRAQARVNEADRVYKTREDTASRALQALELAQVKAEMARKAADETKPEPIGARALSPERAAYQKRLSEWEKADRDARGAEKALELARKQAEQSARERDDAQSYREAALASGDADRAIADELAAQFPVFQRILKNRPAAPAAQPKEGGGILDTLGKMFGGNTPASARAPAPAPAKKKPISFD